ncbi:DNA polymerase/3'-5' exonuclease PolX [Bernardetia sp.]|uniref:DNA polymerase/3'-5' exonuclease PolX n=1 Tax=Bernardetia sp. TaxID=1937974 RepID=UPI0025B88920|nr:DNA polymerase/3'-5' exonuclease PolX [Bernardetia sp.]
MTNKQLAQAFKLTGSLLELHNENSFKVRSYTGTATRLENLNEVAAELSQKQLVELGFSQNMSEKIFSLLENGSFKELDDLTAQTPTGVFEMLNIKGLGAKKIRVIWQELDIETTKDLYEATQDGSLEKTKGFGKKTAENIASQIKFLEKQEGKHRINVAFQYSDYIIQNLEKQDFIEKINVAGQGRRHEPVIDTISFVAILKKEKTTKEAFEFLNDLDGISQDKKQSSPFLWKGNFDEVDLNIEIHFTDKESFYGKLLRESASTSHLNYAEKNAVNEEVSLLEYSYQKSESEEEIYKKIGAKFIPAPLRNGRENNNSEWKWIKENSQSELLELQDLKGTIHNHSTYSDGQNSIEQMALAAQELGHSYLVISDHSQSAFYANGLNKERVEKQWEEIEILNQKLAPFRIFKGIESDILNDGSLDYDENTLKGFEVVIASVHSTLGMSEEKATERLLKAIQNPYTKILGHPTGRLLLRREGYPIDHKKIIDACAECNVAIEINANPYRLDLDWKWIDYAMQKKVWLCISPDAHSTEGLKDSNWGVKVAQKGGLLKSKTLNTLSVEEFESWIESK